MSSDRVGRSFLILRATSHPIAERPSRMPCPVDIGSNDNEAKRIVMDMIAIKVGT
jgi:hypothetical protein